MLSFLTEPFQYAFIQRAMISAVIVGILCSCLGTFIVLRRMAMVGHALTHSALPGMVIAYLLGGSVFVGALIAALVSAWGIGLIMKDDNISEDTAVGMFPTAMFALGILLISIKKSYRDLPSMLFGNILGVTDTDFIFIVVITLITVGLLIVFYKELKLFSVDPKYAVAIGIPERFLRYGLLTLLALTVGVGIQAVGTILTNALLVIPVAAARLITDRLGKMMMLSCVFGVLAAISGVYMSYYWNLSSGASIVMVSVLIFCLAWIWKWITARRGVYPYARK